MDVGVHQGVPSPPQCSSARCDLADDRFSGFQNVANPCVQCLQTTSYSGRSSNYFMYEYGQNTVAGELMLILYYGPGFIHQQDGRQH
ncbi:hypothetical protein MHYP_G00270300 [Metynnis hypsauchen]